MSIFQLQNASYSKMNACHLLGYHFVPRKESCSIKIKINFCQIWFLNINFSNDNLVREFSIQGEGDGTACAVINQLWARLS